MKKQTQPSDLMLIEEFRSGNNKAFDLLFRRHHNFVLHMVRQSLYGSPEEIDDTAQEIFIKLMKLLKDGKYDPTWKLTTFLGRITKNYCTDVFRGKNGKIRARTVSLDAPAFNESEKSIGDYVALDEATPYDLLTECIAKTQKKKKVRQCIHFLTPKRRRLVLLYYFYDLTYAEIVQFEEMPLGTVKATLHAARNDLRNHASLSK